MATKLKGIDVSVWNGNIDWSKAKEEIDFAILRAGYGREVSQKDQKFDANYDGCKANGIPVGVYWYNYAKTVDDAKKEANACIEILKGKTLEYPVWYDIEENATLAAGKEKVSQIADAFCTALKEAGFKVGIYASLSALRNSFSAEIKEKYDVWVAHVGTGGSPLVYTPYEGHKMWQYSWKGKIAGINGDVDQDWSYVEYGKATAPVEEIKEEPKVEKKEEPKVEKKEESKVEKKTTTVKKVETPKQIDVFYCSHSINGWLKQIKNCEDKTSMGYSGNPHRVITGFAAKTSEGKLKYRVHTIGAGWLDWIEQYNLKDWEKGVAGISNYFIDAIEAELVDCPGYQIKYRVAGGKNSEWLPWVTGLEDYAGIYGQPVEKIQMKIEKV